LKLNDRGLLMGGYRADVVVFDLQDIKENATRTKPNQLSSGMSYVFVNGVIAIDNGNFTGKKGGQALYSNKYYK
ncbi:MAG: D-aminoacylase, partial [Clostridia bacterium]|nr:D-aminoacylase [Clostridia bacterium]